MAACLHGRCNMPGLSLCRKAAAVAAFVALPPLGLIAAGAVFCAFAMHVPRRIGPSPAGAADVEISARDQAKLKAWWFEAAGANRGCVIVLHGIGDSRGSGAGFAPMFLTEGYAVLAPDSRAHGESGGKFVSYGLLEKYDVLAWTRWLRGRGCRRIYGLGESLGASILIEASALEPVFGAIVAECPYADLREIAEYRMGQVLPAFAATPIAKLAVTGGILYARAVERIDFDQASPMRAIARSSTPVLLIHGLDDARTPPEHSRRLAAVHPERDRLWLPPRAGHTEAAAAYPAEFRSRVLGWFAAHPPAAAGSQS